MKHEEFITGDNDCIDMVSRNRAVHPGGEKLVLMNEAQAMALLKRASGIRPVRHEPAEPAVTREQLFFQLAHGLAPLFIGLTWVLGAMEGLANPAFTAIVAGVCGLWACVEWKWGKHRA